MLDLAMLFIIGSAYGLFCLLLIWCIHAAEEVGGERP